MRTIKTIKEVRRIINNWKAQNFTVGLVPTMGFLHEGHKSLIRKAAADNDRVIVSIFVNPTQFGPKEDFNKYPRDLEADKKACKEAGAHLIFCPEVLEMYPQNFASYIETSGVSEELCGKSRPGHFRGVATVVAKLFNIVNPDRAYFGQKDAQQIAVIKRLAEDLNFDLQIISCPIVREPDGLAISSRNTYLNARERKAALCLYKAVLEGQKILKSKERDAHKIENALRASIEKEPLA
ncbi:MAG: pantoate--beta-alanine ligase, partial [Elusimicrobiota bacterium]|nr:pantoate--beta-alanine ligase [Elusimicrobiota bacterium]